MNEQDMIALEHWQASTEGRTERRMKDLADVIDDLTTLAQQREGLHMLRACRRDLVSCAQKLVDLMIETKPTAEAAE